MNGQESSSRTDKEANLDAASLLITVQSLLTSIQRSLGDAQSRLDKLGSKQNEGFEHDVQPRVLDLQPPDSSVAKTRFRNPGARGESSPDGKVLTTSYEKTPGREDILASASASKYSQLKAAHSTNKFSPRKISRRHSVSTMRPSHTVVNMDQTAVYPICSQSMYDLSDGDRPAHFPPRWVKAMLKLSEDKPRGSDDTQVHSGQTVANAQESWRTMWNRFRAVDEAQVKDYKEDIDTLLVFAGLFSAVITTFVIAYYVSLQPDSKDVSAFLLFQISSQLSNILPINPTILDANQLSIPSFPFQLSTSVIRINTLWIASLLFALITASLGILVKQWLREYMAMDDMRPDERCRIRHLRFVHLHRWRVFQIASLLPLLLQLAVILFFLGLSEFARTLNGTVGWTVTAIIIVYLAGFAFVTLAPAIWQYCPYKTPFLKMPLQVPRYLLLKLLVWAERQDGIIKSLDSWISQIWDVAPSRLSDLFYLQHFGASAFEFRRRSNRALDISVIISAEGTFLDDSLEHVYTDCLQDLCSFELARSSPFCPLHTPITSIDTNGKLNHLLDDNFGTAVYHSIVDLLLRSAVFPDSSQSEKLASHLLLAATGLSRPRRFPQDISPLVMKTFAEDRSSSKPVLQYFGRFANEYDARTIPISWCSSEGLLNLIPTFMEDLFDPDYDRMTMERMLVVDFALFLSRAVMEWDTSPSDVVTLVRQFTLKMADYIDNNEGVCYYSSKEYIPACLDYLLSLKDQTPEMIDGRFIVALQNLYVARHGLD